MAQTTGFADRCRAHLDDAGAGYFGHLKIASKIGGSLIVAGGACLLHGLLPALFTDKASKTVVRIHNEVQSRKPRPQSAHSGVLEFEI